MNIKTKVISLLALLFVVLIALEVCVQRQILMPSFAQLERDDAKVSMKRIDYALQMTLEGLAVNAVDWGNWADVYRYVQTPNEAFVRTNITPIAMKQLQVNALVIADTKGHIVLSSARTLSEDSELDGDFAKGDELPADFPWRANLTNGRPAKGLIRTSRGVMMIAAGPVLDGSGGGQPLGLVIMGQLLTPHLVHMLGARAQASLSMVQGTVDATGAAPGAAGDRLTETEELTQVDRNFTDIYRKPIMTLRVEVPRRITESGHAAVTYASTYLIGAALTVMLLLAIVLNRVVLEPLPRVTRHAVAIGEGADLTARLNLESRDEIGRLAHEFDRMVARVEDTRRELVDQSFQSGFAELAKGVLHNLGNAMTPLGVRIETLSERLRDAPAADLATASAELQSTPSGSERYRDLEQFLRLGCNELASVIADSRADVAVVQRQAKVVQTALIELMNSTRNDHVMETVRLPDLVIQSLEIVPDACRQRLVVDTDESLGRVGTVRVARTVLRLVLQNLIINAADAVRDAGRDKGVLKVAAEIVREHDRDQLHLHCNDNGVGIAQQDLQRVFEQGFSTKSKETNYGIGLHWCANAMGALGGRIWAASEGPGLGASLHLMLPLVVREN
jgi:two-component system, NtrC family, sensor kinase